jgi:exodeoxyribonuclease VII small subunit
MTSNDQFDFGAGLKELEEITAWFESEEVDLDEGLKKFERGMALAGQLRDHLAVIENRVEKIKVKFAKSAGDEEEPQPRPTGSDQLF